MITPSPWYVVGRDEEGTLYIGAPRPANETRLDNILSGPNAEGNAVMASKAPDMFEALELIQKTIREDDMLSLDPELAGHADAIDSLLRPIREAAVA